MCDFRFGSVTAASSVLMVAADIIKRNHYE
jgi:hypothetical protein